MRLGVIGGLGPMATAYFMQLVIDMTKAERDQDHLEMIIYNCPSIPDRTAYILGKSKENPVEPILAIGRKLAAQDVDCVAIPCITAHYFHDEIERGIGCRVIHAIRDTARMLADSGVRTVGIMATDGTIQSGIFQRELVEAGLEVLTPDPAGQSLVMGLIYDDVKSGRRPHMDRFRRAADSLFTRGAEVIILGCTELSVIKRDFSLGPGFIDALEVLARSSVLACGKEVREEYRTLFTPHREKRISSAGCAKTPAKGGH